MVAHAEVHRFKRILILEEDALFSFSFQPAAIPWTRGEVQEFESFLSSDAMEYTRLGYLALDLPSPCSKECKCRKVGAHVCQVRAGCDLRGSEAYVISSKVFSLFQANASHKSPIIDMWPW
jgi:hypothetical protein